MSRELFSLFHHSDCVNLIRLFLSDDTLFAPWYVKHHLVSHCLRGFVSGPCFVLHYLVTFLVLQSSLRRGESWLLYFDYFTDVL